MDHESVTFQDVDTNGFNDTTIQSATSPPSTQMDTADDVNIDDAARAIVHSGMSQTPIRMDTANNGMSSGPDAMGLHGAKDCTELSLGPSLLKPTKNGSASQSSTKKEKALEVQRQAAAKYAHLFQPQAIQKLLENVNENFDGGNATTLREHDVPNDSPESSPKAHRGRAKPEKDPAALKFAKIKAGFESKQRAETVSLQEEIEYLKIEAQEKARLKKLDADKDYDRLPTPDDDGDGIFVPEGPKAPEYSSMVSEDEDGDDDGDKAPAKKRGVKRKRDNEGQPPRRGRPRGSVTKSRKVHGTDYTETNVTDILHQAKHGRATGPAKARAKGKRKKARGPEMTNLGSILGTNVFGDTEALKGKQNQPGFEEGANLGRRQNALKSLIASVPEESKKIATVDKKYLDDACKAFTGQGAVTAAEDGNWRVKGMRSTLKHYQILGTAFMRWRENDINEPKGGILADEMGLGKTLMTLANIVNGLPKEKAKRRATLIVASPALLTQWWNEIERHCHSNREKKQHHGLGAVLRYHSGSRMVSNNIIDVLEQADIVLTTYHEVAKSYPKAIVPPNLVIAKQKDEWWKDYFENEKGLLHTVQFLRIVLDEAQTIKNHRGHTSMACRAVNAKFHWALSGTPIMNNIKEFYPYFKFLREPHTGSYRIFKENFCSPDDPDGIEKLNVFLRKFMIRRTHLDTLFDARLLDLPQPKETTLWVEFNDVERQIYEIVKKRFIRRINTISKSNGLEKQYSHIWVMILRLRQLCSHSLLVQGTIMDLLEQEDFELLKKLTVTEGEISDECSDLLIHLRNILKTNVGVKTIEGGMSGSIITESEIVPTGVMDVESVDQTTGHTGGKHGLSFRFRKYLDSLVNSKHWDAIVQRTLCSGCRQPPKNPYVTSCFHIYCLACLKDLQHYAARRGQDQARCSECGELYSSTQPCEGLDTFQVRASTTLSSSEDSQSAISKKGKKRKIDDVEDWISLSGEVLPSAKTQAVKAQIMNWLEEDSTAKIIIYTQFLPMITILAKVCQTEGWDYCKYTGQMSHESRDKAIAEFAKEPNKKILLASLKSGGLGLNLTMASRVICLDPWWNAAVEQQAFCRVFRIGQQKETLFTRFVVKNTIDAAMVAVKERKQYEIEEVMNDSKKKERLSIQDLMRLFGNVGEDADGKPFIFADDDEDQHLTLPAIDDEEEDQMMGNDE